jgi:hypothetical protein
VQLSFRKFSFFNSLLMIVAVLAAHLPIRALPNRRLLSPAEVTLTYRPVALPPFGGPLSLSGAWELQASDPRFGGLSALAIDHGGFLAVSDLGAVVRFDPPSAASPQASLADLRDGPGDAGRKSSRDAESLARDPRGRGWWIGYEQRHSLWLYDQDFAQALAAIDLKRSHWRDNRGAEGLIAERDALLVLAENGRDAMRVRTAGIDPLPLDAGMDVADATRAPDGSAWLLLRSKGRGGISQSIAPLLEDANGYRIGPAWPLPQAAFDNYEGRAIAPLPGGGWRFWLVSDDGHRLMARTLLVALDLARPPVPRHDKSPADQAGLSRNPSVEAP